MEPPRSTQFSLGSRWSDVLPLLVLFVLIASLPSAADPPPAPQMHVTYHPKAKAPYDPEEPMWTGEPPCSQYPTSGQGTLQAGGDSPVTPPRLAYRKQSDYSKLSSKTRPFAPFIAECTVSAEGRLGSVRVLRSVSDEFDRLILAELASTRWTPATLNGARVAACLAFTARPHP